VLDSHAGRRVRFRSNFTSTIDRNDSHRQLCMSATRDFIAAEKAFLDKVYHTYTVDTSSQTMTMRKLIVRTFSPYLRGGRGLELGCSDGFITEMLAERLGHLDVVDGSRKFLAEARKRDLPNVRFVESLFEEYTTSDQYDSVFASYILEHVYDPLAVLNMARSVLRPDGLLFIIVPNARALSRQLALHMGLLNDLKELTENDRNHGHRRVYDRVSLNADLAAAGLENVAQGGIMLKILADFQMDRLIDSGVLQQQQIDGLYSLGLEYPDLCGSLFSVCRIKR
jgi:2-polyprenyl-3-methyl-5-hydroxy-6-metoxy-1,4-benzoquinol methylase